jgi:hypothetical protein
MIARGFDQELASQASIDYQNDLEAYPPELEEYEYSPAAESYYPSEPSYCYSPGDLPGDYYMDDYPTDDYPPADFSLGALPKTLFVCTILACLILAVGLSLVTFQVSSIGDQAVVESDSIAAPATLDSQSPAGSTLLAGADNSTCSVSQRFPDSIRRWCGLITQYAGKHGLPPNLVAALILQESGGNPVAYSRSGAVGLMQIMPSDGLAASFQCAGGPCFSTRPKTDELKNPEFNVSFGTRMLAGLVGKTGSLREALKSYGPMDVGYYYADKVLGIYQRYGN